jgi:hypothetical protein
MVFLSGYSSKSLPSVACNASPDKEKEHNHLSITVQRYKKDGNLTNFAVFFNKL